MIDLLVSLMICGGAWFTLTRGEYAGKVHPNRKAGE